MEGRLQQNSLINTIHKDNLATQVISILLVTQTMITLKVLSQKVLMSTTNLGKISSPLKILIVLLETSPNNL